MFNATVQIFRARATLQFLTHFPKLSPSATPNFSLTIGDIPFLSTFDSRCFGFMCPRISVLRFSTRFIHSYGASQRDGGISCRNTK